MMMSGAFMFDDLPSTALLCLLCSFHHFTVNTEPVHRLTTITAPQQMSTVPHTPTHQTHVQL
jgi:hypothetical protein